MGILKCEKTLANGKKETVYMVVVEAINRFTNLRVQKKKRGISSELKALRIEKELWHLCQNERPDNIDFVNWHELLKRYSASLTNKIRSETNPLGLSPQVVRSKHSRIKHLKAWSDVHLDLITPQFVSDELDKLEKNQWSRSATNHLLKEIKCLFVFAVNLGVIKANPFAGFKLRKMPKKHKQALNHAEANKLLAEAKLRNHPYYYIWLLSIALGVRRSELAGLQWIDFDFDQGLVYVRRQEIPREGMVNFLKNRVERVVAMPKHIIPALKELKMKCKSDRVIEIKCHRWAAGQQARIIKEFCREIGIKEITHHQLRATHITMALVDGIPLGIVKENVGHSKLSTTDEYFRSAGINMRGQTDGLRLQVPQENGAEVLKFKK